MLVTGITGFIGAAVGDALRGRHVIGAARDRSPAGGGGRDVVAMDLAQPSTIVRALDTTRAGAVIHCAAVRDLAQCEREPGLATTVNVDATREIARWCAANGARLLFLSTDQVFDGRAGMYREHDPRRPLNHYGMTKALAEDAVLTAGGVVLRVALTLGHTRERTRSPNEFIVDRLRRGEPATLYENEFRSPILVDDAARAIAHLAQLPECPAIVHVGGPARVNRVAMGLAVARAYGLPDRLCVAGRHDPAAGLMRPLDASMDNRLLRSLLPGDAHPRGLLDAVRVLTRGPAG